LVGMKMGGLGEGKSVATQAVGNSEIDVDGI
jgi:hypothetical protein